MKKTITKPHAIFTFFLLVSVLFSCTKTNNTPAVSFNGNWSGTATPTNPNPNNYQAGTISMALTQSGSNITGTFTFTQNAVGGTGSVSGSINGTNVILTLKMTYPANPQSHLYNIYMSETVNASYSAISGTFNVTDGSGAYYYDGLFTANK